MYSFGDFYSFNEPEPEGRPAQQARYPKPFQPTLWLPGRQAAALTREPRLLVPRQKPVGSVRVNWSNNITNNLFRVFVPVVSIGSSTSNYLYNQNKLFILNPPNTRLFFAGEGTYLFRPDEGLYLSTIETLLEGGTLYSGNVPVTLFAVVKLTALSTGTSWVKIVTQRHTYATAVSPTLGVGNTSGIGSSTYSWFFMLDANSLAKGYKHNVQPELDKWYFICGTYNGNGPDPTNFKIYVDGVDSSITQLSYGSVGSVNFNGGTPTYGPRVSSNNVFIKSVFEWKRCLSSAEVASLASDPYQFLIPA